MSSEVMEIPLCVSVCVCVCVYANVFLIRSITAHINDADKSSSVTSSRRVADSCVSHTESLCSKKPMNASVIVAGFLRVFLPRPLKHQIPMMWAASCPCLIRPHTSPHGDRHTKKNMVMQQVDDGKALHLKKQLNTATIRATGGLHPFRDALLMTLMCLWPPHN